MLKEIVRRPSRCGGKSNTRGRGSLSCAHALRRNSSTQLASLPPTSFFTLQDVKAQRQVILPMERRAHMDTRREGAQLLSAPLRARILAWPSVSLNASEILTTVDPVCLCAQVSSTGSLLLFKLLQGCAVLSEHKCGIWRSGAAPHVFRCQLAKLIPAAC